MKLLAQVNIPGSFFQYHANASITGSNPGALISIITPTILVAAGIVFFFLILFGGFSLVVGAGKNSSPQDAAKAKAALTYGVVGFLLVVSAYFILQIVSLAITGSSTTLTSP